MKLVQSVSRAEPVAVPQVAVSKAWQMLLAAIISVLLVLAASPARAADAAQLDKEAHAALQDLYAKVPAAKVLGEKARAILVFPSITKAGLVIGGQYGEGALIRGGKAVAYYSTAGASYGLQAGVQKYGYAMMFMTDEAFQALDKVDGFEVGVGPTVVVVDEGVARNATTATMKDDIYAFVFDQKGLMAGIGIQGTKITKLQK
ncbi:lipid-binding SYLF domain-containing protein [Pseudomonas sp. AN-1]|uniref:lipid-binding SYLF domain-containing protein n=1 Tax=Pseudomonas sp. AN-1 TaxID=3096605 RepID=UPI002A6A977E|nr:lipid-binding SYLF domain-containing protein [Pseudomonas sp. AN-1]WPP47767.1 lipid-binding SYLF domain-containing protein [Pseudomonas sp. AN-1]